MSQVQIRTQISLPLSLKLAIEEEAKLLGESMSEFLRTSASIRLARKSKLEQLAKNFVGSAKNNPNWKTKKDIDQWFRAIRSEWPL